jgi:hypothetical protein
LDNVGPVSRPAAQNYRVFGGLAWVFD